jgi:hypothetical protein
VSPDITNENLEKYGTDLQALFLNIFWEPGIENSFSIDDLRKLKISKKVMKNGILFIWSHKHYLSEVNILYKSF